MSAKLPRLFLPIVIIGALGIGMIVSVMTASPVLASGHQLCVDDPREHMAYPCKEAGSGSDIGRSIALIGFLLLVAIAASYNIRESVTTHPVNKYLDGETYPNPWILESVLWLGLNIALLCAMLYLIVFALQGRN
ncbi:hypothetical protein FIM04_04055 [SAR202 cluster bacterium AC-409-J13_OGT_754m]|nr:hypothetical protein [SAR202 cluster bacterium AC-409-J13_OGT_754m]